MQRWYYMVPLCAAGALALACSDTPTGPSGQQRTALRPSATLSVTGAAFTTIDPTYTDGSGVTDGTGHCQNGNPAVNCNIYDGKRYVWLNGGPLAAQLPDGDYFWVVLAPGGQPDPLDGSAKNLSDDTDPYTNRRFTKTGSTISYSGTHDFDVTNQKLRVGVAPPLVTDGPDWFADTPNPGGVYILGICSISAAGSYAAVTPRVCKFDAFKVKNSTTAPVAIAPDLYKDANGADTRTYNWRIGKQVDRTRVEQLGGSATFNYTVTVTRTGSTVSSVTVAGTISVYNPNLDDDGNTVPITISDITDQLSNGAPCAVTIPAGSKTLTTLQTDFAYTCDLGSSLPTGALNNTATVAWSTQTLSNTAVLAGDSRTYTARGISFTETAVDDAVTVTDRFNGTTYTLGTVPPFDAGSTDTKTFTYPRTVPVPSYGCKSYDNTATFTSNTAGSTTTGSAGPVTVTVCGPARTGALTMGFWQNKNGQGIISADATTNKVCNLTTWLRQFHPFSDLGATAKCSEVATYVYNVIKAATAGGTTMNPMLKAQMLATALDVYFSDPNRGGNKIGAYSGLGTSQPAIGGITIDLTMICKMTDGASGSTCSGTAGDVSAAFGGATSLTVMQMLTYQNTADPATDSGANWYSQVKSTQEMAKNAFDAINNQVAFAAP